MPFGDYATVIADRSKQSWKIRSGTVALNPDHTTVVDFASMYQHPTPDMSGIGRGGFPTSGNMITIYREGEAYAPQSDDVITTEGESFLIQKVLSRLNADELTLGYAVYDCTVSRISNPS